MQTSAFHQAELLIQPAAKKSTLHEILSYVFRQALKKEK
jgi:hypothetical protein